MPRRPALMFAYDHASQEALLAAREEIDMVVVPGSIATVHQRGTSCFLSDLGRPYVIDPRTVSFQYPDRMPKPAGKNLAAAHGLRFANHVLDHGSIWDLDDEDWLQAAACVAQFQREFSTACPPGTAPAMIFPAYLMIEPGTPGADRAWELNLAMLRETRTAVQDRPVTAMAALASTPPGEPDLAALGRMLRDLSEMRWPRAAAIWLDGFDEYSASVDTVAGLGALVSSWRHLALMTLHGGYLSLLLHHFGLAGVASGITYGQSRSARRPPGEPDFRPRYYLPSAHVAVRPIEAEAFIRLMGPWAQCPCAVCVEHADGVAVSRLSYPQLRRHFALAQIAERDHVAGNDLRALVAELRGVERAIEHALAEAPPWAKARDVPHRHLKAWADGLDAADPPES